LTKQSALPGGSLGMATDAVAKVVKLLDVVVMLGKSCGQQSN